MKYFSTLKEKFCISAWPCNNLSSIYVDDDIDIGIDQDDKKKDSYTLTKPHKPPAEKMSGKEQESSTTRLLQTACQPLASRKIHCK